MINKLLLSLAIIVSSLILAPSAFASTLSLSPSIANIPQGSTVSVQVRLNTNGESVNGISAYLSYPSDKLTVSYVNSSSSAFAIEAEGTYGGGVIRISRGNMSGVVGSVNVATIGLVGKSIGTATVAFIGGSSAPRTSDSSDSLILGGSTGGTYTIGIPSKLSITPIATDAAKPVIKDIKVTNISTNSALVNWETDELSDSTFEYGLSPDKYFLTIYDKTLTATHSSKLEGEAIEPGAILHFRVKSKDKFGNEGISKDSIIQIIGHKISLKVLDTEGNPLKDIEVQLFPSSQKSITNAAGEVTFANVTEGKHLVVLKSGLIERTEEIDVTSSFAIQKFTLKQDLAPSKTIDYNIYLIAIAVSITGALIILIIVILIRKRKNDSIKPPLTPIDSNLMSM